VALSVLLLTVAAACGGGNPTTTLPLATPPSTPGTTGLPGVLPTPGELPTPVTRPPWPEGWDAALCATFTQLVETQELAVDIGRALDEDERADARGLTAELSESATATRELLEEMPEWGTAEPIEQDIATLLDLADEMALRYDRYLNDNRRPALGRAQEAGAQMADVVEPLLERLTLLSEQGLRCPDVPFRLETPPTS
jgi:hypothetical protein